MNEYSNNPLYLESGFLDFKYILESRKLNVPFCLITGGRGTGKTYGALEYVVEHNIKFIYMRRTQTEVDEIYNPSMSPFKSLNKDKNWNINPLQLTKSVSGWYDCQLNDDGKLVPKGLPIGYLLALSTVANIRGFDASDVDIILYDEFIPEKHKKRINGEAEALLNAYETVNRNRELLGRPPCKLIGLSNSNNIANAIYIYLNIVNKVFEMRNKGQETYIDRSRGLACITLDESPISNKKSETALYKLTKGTSFYSMAIDNEFENVSTSKIKSMPLKEYTPFLTIGELTFYEHKSRKEIYVSPHQSGTVPTFSTTKTDRIRIKKLYNWLWIAYLNNYFIFESLMLEILFVDYFNYS